eukprot:g22676.t2
MGFATMSLGLSKALAAKNHKEVEEVLANWSELMRLSQVLAQAHALRPAFLLRRLAKRSTVADAGDEYVQKHQKNYNMILQRGLQGKGHLDLKDEDLIGLSDEMKSVWASHLGSAAVWRSKYRVPIGPHLSDSSD